MRMGEASIRGVRCSTADIITAAFILRSVPCDQRFLQNIGPTFTEQSVSISAPASGMRRAARDLLSFAPPVGLVVAVLPPYYSTVWIGSSPYYYANDVYYVWQPEQNGYVVVDPPAHADVSAAHTDDGAAPDAVDHHVDTTAAA